MRITVVREGFDTLGAPTAQGDARGRSQQVPLPRCVLYYNTHLANVLK